MIIADLSELHHKFKAKRTGMSAAEYANPYAYFKPRSTAATKAGYALAVLLVIAAIYLGAK